MLKKFLGVLTACCMLFTMAQPWALADGTATVVVGSGEVTVGDTDTLIPIEISLKNNGDGVQTVYFEVTYDDTALEVAEAPETHAKMPYVDQAPAGDDLKTSPLTLDLGDASGDDDVTDDIVVATVKFKIKSNATVGEYPITIENQENYKANFDSVEYAVEAGKITVKTASTKVKVTFDADNGSSPDVKEIDKDTAVAEPTAPTKDGYTFDGWFNGSTKWDFTQTVSADMTLKAQWTVPDTKVTVTFDADGGTPAPALQTITKGSAATEPTPAPTKDNLTFDGWYNGDTKWVFTNKVDTSITLKAKWITPDETVTVTFDADGGTPAPESKTIAKDTAVAEPTAPTKNGYKFDGWFNGSSKWDFTQTVSADMTLKAQWTKNSDPKSNDGCYVATSVYGSYDAPEVWTLRQYRDEVLGSTWYGRLFIKAYYATSPTLVKWFGDADWFQNFFRARLDQMVDGLQAEGFTSAPYEDINW